jgi:rod shape-determining protein MreC
VAKPRRSRRTLATLLVLVLISVTVISLDESGRTHSLTSGIKSVAADVFSPLRSGVNGILRPVGDFFAGAVHYGSIQQENHKLQVQIGTLRQGAAETSRQQEQLQQLDKLLQSDDLPSVRTLSKVTAQTTAEGTSNFAATITIDKGRSEGVAVTDPVIAGGGLVGKVVQASHSTAIVQLVTDGQSQVGVTFGNPPQDAVVDGQGSGKAMSVEFVAPNVPVHVGQVMYTNGLQGAEFPSGIPVALVTSVRTVPGAAQKDVRARSFADLQTLAYVQVIQWSPAP